MENRQQQLNDYDSFFEDVIPENVDDLVENLNEYRKTIKGDFEQKVKTLNEFTKGLIEKRKVNND